MNREQLILLLESLVMAHSPSGHEDEIKQLNLESFKERSDKVWEDPAGNIICLIKGKASERPTILTAHMDEIGMLVKRVEEKGRLKVTNLGGAWPWKWGEGPVDVLGDREIVAGILSFGSTHITKETSAGWAARTEKPLDWDMVWVETKLTKEELTEKGIHAGSRVVMGRARKKPVILGDYIGAYGLDCKGGIAVLVILAETFRQSKPAHDVYLAATREEETGGIGAIYLARTIPAETMIAVEIGIVGEEFQVENTPDPIIYYSGGTLYDEDLGGCLTAIARELGFGVQHALLIGGTDAGKVRSSGLVAKGGCVGFATDNSHGYEISCLSGIENVAKMLAVHLSRG